MISLVNTWNKKQLEPTLFDMAHDWVSYGIGSYIRGVLYYKHPNKTGFSLYCNEKMPSPSGKVKLQREILWEATWVILRILGFRKNFSSSKKGGQLYTSSLATRSHHSSHITSVRVTPSPWEWFIYSSLQRDFSRWDFHFFDLLGILESAHSCGKSYKKLAGRCSFRKWWDKANTSFAEILTSSWNIVVHTANWGKFIYRPPKTPRKVW